MARRSGQALSICLAPRVISLQRELVTWKDEGIRSRNDVVDKQSRSTTDCGAGSDTPTRSPWSIVLFSVYSMTEKTKFLGSCFPR